MASTGKTVCFSGVTGCVISPCPLWEKAQRGGIRGGSWRFRRLPELSSNQQLTDVAEFYTGTARRVH